MDILISFLLIVSAFEVMFSIFGIYVLVQEKSVSEKDIRGLDESTKEYKDKIFSYLMLKDIVLKGFIQNIPSIIGGGILLFSLINYSGVIRSIGFFIIGFNGIFRMAFSFYIYSRGILFCREKSFRQCTIYFVHVGICDLFINWQLKMFIVAYKVQIKETCKKQR